MKKICKFLTIPTALFDTPDISILSKWVLIAIDSVYDGGQGVAIGIQALSSMTNLPNKTIKDCLTELYEHGAVEVLVSDGQKFLKPLMYRESYPNVGAKIVVGDKPADSETIDYGLIQDTWNKTCATLPRIDKFTARRKQKTRTCLKGASATISDMIKVIRLVATSAFLNGSKTDWSATYDWVIKSPDNFTKVLEGQYHKDYNERVSYEAIMRGEEVNQKQSDADNFYR